MWANATAIIGDREKYRLASMRKLVKILAIYFSDRNYHVGSKFIFFSLYVNVIPKQKCGLVLYIQWGVSLATFLSLSHCLHLTFLNVFLKFSSLLTFTPRHNQVNLSDLPAAIQALVYRNWISKSEMGLWARCQSICFLPFGQPFILWLQWILPKWERQSTTLP